MELESDVVAVVKHGMLSARALTGLYLALLTLEIFADDGPVSENLFPYDVYGCSWAVLPPVH